MPTDRDEVLRVLASYRQRLLRDRDALDARFQKEVAKGRQLQQEADRRAQEYRSTPQGIAESMREIETAQLAGQPRDVLRRLQRRHFAAEQVSVEEYTARCNRWGHKPGDGPVRGCPAGSHPPMRMQIMRERVFGSYRHDPSAAAVRIDLFRITERERLRTQVTVPIEEGMRAHADSIDLCTIITWALSNGATSDRILTRLNLDPTVWLPLASAHLAAPAVRAD